MHRLSRRIVRLVPPIALLATALLPAPSGCHSKVCPATEDPLVVCSNDCERYVDVLTACCATATDRAACEASVTELSDSCPEGGPAKAGESDDSWSQVRGWANPLTCIPEADAGEYEYSSSTSDPDDDTVAALAGRLCSSCFGGKL